MSGKGWVLCRKCRRRIYRIQAYGIEVAPGATVRPRLIPPDRVAEFAAAGIHEPGEAYCPRGHLWGGVSPAK